jgi:hypothetical protein
MIPLPDCWKRIKMRILGQDFNWQGLPIYFLLAAVCLLVSCVPASQSEVVASPTPNTGQTALGTPISVGTRLPATRAPILDTLPDDLVRSFNREQCPDWCWHDVMLGQTEAEALDALRLDASVDRSIDFLDGDYLRIESFENGFASIDWFILGLDISSPSYRWHTHATVAFTNGIADFMIIPLQDTFPVSAVVEELGEPDLISFYSPDPDPVIPVLTYTNERVQLVIQTGEIAYLTEQSRVQSMLFLSQETLLHFICNRDYRYIPWEGFSSLLQYARPLEEALPLPEACP